MRLGTLSDLDEALSLARNALELLPQDHPNRAGSMSLISNRLIDRFTQLGCLT